MMLPRYPPHPRRYTRPRVLESIFLFRQKHSNEEASAEAEPAAMQDGLGARAMSDGPDNADVTAVE